MLGNGKLSCTQVRFMENSARFSGGAIINIAIREHSVFDNCTFFGNQASDAGGACFLALDSPFLPTLCPVMLIALRPQS